MSSFYVIGTKYGPQNNVDNMPTMLEKGVVSIGFCWDIDFTEYYGGDTEKLDKYLMDNEESGHEISQMKLFLSLRPGDIIAIKSAGSPKKLTKSIAVGRLEIIAYTIVVERDGIVYRHDTEDPSGLGHLINVDFIKRDFRNELPIGGYGKSIHKVDNVNDINEIFGAADDTRYIVENTLSISVTKQKNTNKQVVLTSAEYIREAVHNQIQQNYYNQLVQIHGADNVSMEENYVDIVVRATNRIELIEVKPYVSVVGCIREGLGQLLSYYYSHYLSSQNVQLTIFGPKKPDESELKFIQFIQSSLRVSLKYESWENVSQE